MGKLVVEINPTVNNLPYITSRVNLAKGSGCSEIIFMVLDWKIETYDNMSKYRIVQKRKGYIDVWSTCLENLDIIDVGKFAEYVADFCEKTYRGG